MATGSFDGQVQGLNQLQQQEQRKYGPGNYMPNVRVVYWSMRVMAFAGVAMFLVAALGALALPAEEARAGALVPTGPRSARSRSRTSPRPRAGS